MPGSASPAASLSIVVPVHDEAAALPFTAPLLLTGLPAEAEIVYVCNGCTDRSADIVRGLADPRLRVIELPHPGKTAALREGERRCTGFPRFFVDADVAIAGADLARLAALLRSEQIELVSPRLSFDLTGASPAAREANKVWLSLPHGESAAFQQVIGISREGRARWGEMPDLTADDSFILSHIPPDRRRIAGDIMATVRPPATLAALVGVRLRILKGLVELERAGIARPRAPEQRRALCRALLRPETAFGATAYVATGLIARALFTLGFGRKGWYRDESSRKLSDAGRH